MVNLSRLLARLGPEVAAAAPPIEVPVALMGECRGCWWEAREWPKPVLVWLVVDEAGVLLLLLLLGCLRK